MAADHRRAARRVCAAVLAMAIVSGPLCATAQADDAIGGLLGGVSDILQGVFALPFDIVAGTLTGPPIIGTISGAFRGVFQTVGLGLRGALKLVGAAIPLAAKAAPLIPIFL